MPPVGIIFATRAGPARESSALQQGTPCCRLWDRGDTACGRSVGTEPSLAPALCANARGARGRGRGRSPSACHVACSQGTRLRTKSRGVTSPGWTVTRPEAGSKPSADTFSSKEPGDSGQEYCPSLPEKMPMSGTAGPVSPRARAWTNAPSIGWPSGVVTRPATPWTIAPSTTSPELLTIPDSPSPRQAIPPSPRSKDVPITRIAGTATVRFMKSAPCRHRSPTGGAQRAFARRRLSQPAADVTAGS